MSESTYSRDKRDKRIADTAESTVDRSLQCQAHGCPNRWSVDGGNGKCCSAHAWADRHQWPLITREQEQADDDRRRWAEADVGRPPRQVNRAEIVQRLRAGVAALGDMRGGKAWAHRLRDREAGGERMGQAQRECWRVALRMEASAAAAQPARTSMPFVAPEDIREVA